MAEETKDEPTDGGEAEPEVKVEEPEVKKAAPEKPEPEKNPLTAKTEELEAKKPKDDKVPEGHDPTPKVDAEGNEIDPKAAPKVDEPKKIEAYSPEGLQEHLQGKDDKETIDNLKKAYDGARKQISKGEDIPEKADGYKLDEKSLEVIKGDDEGLAVIQKVFVENGISNQKFNGILQGIFPALKEAGLLPDLPTAEENMAALGDEGPAIVAFVAGKLNQIAEAGFLSEDERAAVLSIGDNPAGISGLSKIFQSYGEKAVPVQTKAIEGSLSQAELNQLLSDPRYDANSPKYDEAYAKDVAAKFLAFHGNKPSGVSPKGIAGGV